MLLAALFLIFFVDSFAQFSAVTIFLALSFRCNAEVCITVLFHTFSNIGLSEVELYIVFIYWGNE